MKQNSVHLSLLNTARLVMMALSQHRTLMYNFWSQKLSESLTELAGSWL